MTESATTPPRFYVGQAVILRDVNDRGRAPREVTITRVGRTKVYVEQYGREQGFYAATGREGGKYDHAWITPREEYEAAERRRELWNRLDAHGLGKSRHGADPLDLSTETLEAILALIEADHG